MVNIIELETIFGQETGQWDIPKTIWKGGSVTDYDPEIFSIRLAREDPDFKSFPQFIWLHEAYHHYQTVCEGFDFNDDILRDKVSNDAYLYIPSERAANIFAHRLCVKYGWPIPDYFPEGYFIKIT